MERIAYIKKEIKQEIDHARKNLDMYAKARDWNKALQTEGEIKGLMHIWQLVCAVDNLSDGNQESN